MINHKSQGKGQIQVPKLTQPCSSLIGDIYQEKKHWKPDDSVRVVAIMLQIKARREHHAAAMLAHVESLATSCKFQSKQGDRNTFRCCRTRTERCVMMWFHIDSYAPRKASIVFSSSPQQSSIVFSSSPQQCTPPSSTDHRKTAETCAETGGRARGSAAPRHYRHSVSLR